MNDILASGAIHSVKAIFQKKTERNVIIDPFSCLVKLSLLRFLEQGTKISIYQNRIHFNSPSYIQGFIRFMYGDNREHLHNLYLPIQKCVEWFWDNTNVDMTYMFNNAVIGLKMLKYAYSEYATIQHTIDYYIIIMMQKNTHLISKMGITTLDIHKITNGMMECQKEYCINNYNDKQDLVKQESVRQDLVKQDLVKQDISNTINTNDKNKKYKNKNDKNDKHDIPVLDTKETTDTKEITDIKELNTKDTKDIHLKDMHKFLVEIWNLREIDIVINLYREMESKNAGYERDNIYSNIMSYCSMKENKLFEYIESNSSIL